MNVLNLTPDRLSKLIDKEGGEYRDKIAVRSIAQFLAYMSYENKEYTLEIISVCAKGVQDK